MYLHVPRRRALAHDGLGQSGGPFEGVFTGDVRGDTPGTVGVKVTLTHRDARIAGTIAIGYGLRLLFGPPCGFELINADAVAVTGTWDPARPNHLEAAGVVDELTENLPGFRMKVLVRLVADLYDTNTIGGTLIFDPLDPSTERSGTRVLPLLLKRS